MVRAKLTATPPVKGTGDGYKGAVAGLESTRGRLLVATPLLGDPNFERTVIFMLEDNEEGALGLVLNRPSPLEVTEPLPDWSRLVASAVGGVRRRTRVA